ncbi:unnamed protein product [Paramecium primaurelia]|uniref:Cyclic nucleotide-binding domain-containing protein n=1 Tax=Paramecium primaurelia TaxID=5886 RepID=A0A8S1MGA3_PARPR|nr:unnamed protein product [Paramecium primaurelia]
MSSYFCEQDIKDFTSPRFILDGATPHVDPKVGSNSDVQFQSEISNMESMRSLKQETTMNKNKLVKKNSQILSIKFDQSVNKKLQNTRSQFKNENIQNDGQQLKQVLGKQMLLKFKDRLLSNAHILTKQMMEEKKNLLNYLFLDDALLEGRRTKKKQTLSKLEEWFIFPVFLPQDRFVKVWSLFSILCSFFILWLSPFISSFQLQKSEEIQRITEIVFIYLLIDGLIANNRAILVQGELIVSRKKIIQNYLRFQIVNDLVNFIIWLIMYQGVDNIQISQCLSIIQIVIIIFTVYNKINNFVDCLYLNGRLSEILDLIFLIISLYYFIHIIGCLWHYLALVSEELNQQSWLSKYSLENQSYWVKYDYAIYWATMTMVTVGYGDITAANPIEILFSNFTMFVSSFVFAYSVNSIGMIIKNFYDHKNQYKRQLILINTFMKNNLVDDSIQNRVRNYLKNQVDQEGKSNQIEAQQILENLPPGLKNEVNFNIKTRIIKNVKILFNNFSKTTINQVTSQIEQINYIPNDVIYNPEERHKDFHIYYVDSGQVKLVEIRTKKIVQTYNEGQTFGEYQFMSGFDTKFMIISSQFTQLYKISRLDFLKVLQNNQKDKELFQQIKDQLIYLSDYSLIGKKCSLCNNYDHMNSDCFLISYKPNLETLIKREGFTLQQRTLIRRNDRQKLKVLSSITGIVNTVVQFQQQELISNQNETQTIISGTRKIKDQPTRRQSDYKTEQHEGSSLSDQSPDIRQERIQDTTIILQQKLNSRRQSQSQTGKFATSQQSNKHIENKDKRKMSIAYYRESSYINPDGQSAQLIQQKSLKQGFSSNAIIEIDDHNKHNCKSLNLDIDKLYQFQNYMPQSNAQSIIFNLNKQKSKASIYSNNLKKAFKFTFYYKVAKLACGMRLIIASTSRRLLKPAGLKKTKEQFQQ